MIDLLKVDARFKSGLAQHDPVDSPHRIPVLPDFILDAFTMRVHKYSSQLHIRMRVHKYSSQLHIRIALVTLRRRWRDVENRETL